VIEWKGLFANTPYSSANNKTQDDAVVGMQDTIYVTGPGYGGYSANVRVHNASGAVVALIPVSGGGGALSAPAPVRILDDSTTYSYSLEVVRGAVPSDDADKIVIRIVGGASKRYPGQGSTLPDGSTSFAGPVRIEGDLVADSASFGGPARFGDTLVADKPIVAPWVTTKLDRLLRIATFGDSTASSIGVGSDVGAGANCDQERMYTPFPGSGSTEYKTWQSTATAHFWIPSLIVATGGIIGQQVQQMLDRSKAAYSATRKSLEDVDAKRPDAILFHGASINDYLGMTASTPQATIDAVVDKHRQMVEFYTSRCRHVVDSGCYGYSVAGPNLAAVCAIIVQTNAALKQLAKNNPYWHFIDTAGITHDGTSLYIPSCTSDGTHLSPTGGFWIGKAEAEILDRLFISGESGDVIWDQSVDFANAVANQPANLDLDLGGSSLTVVSKSVEPSKYTVVVDAQAGGNLKTWVKNLSAAGGAP